MKRFMKLAVIGALVAAVTSPIAPASADIGPVSDVITTVGSGYVSPGLPTLGCQFGNTYTIVSNLVVAGDETGTGGFVFNGNSEECDNVTSSNYVGTVTGTLALTNTPFSSPVTGSLTMQRTLNVVTVSGNISFFGETHQIMAWTCEWTHTSFAPTVTFELDCGALLVS